MLKNKTVKITDIVILPHIQITKTNYVIKT